MNGFRICQLDIPTGAAPTYSRRDFYTVCLLAGPCYWPQADQPTKLDGPCLLIGNPAGVGLVASVAAHHLGYACRFTEAFFKAHSPIVNPAQWTLLNDPAPHVFALGREQAAYLNDLFAKMLAEQQATYPFKQELLGAYLNLVLHEAMRLRTPTRLFQYYCRPAGTQCELRTGRRR